MDYKLTYFDIDGGRGEPVRIALHAAGIDFEDIRWTFPDFAVKRTTLRFQSVPTLEIDGQSFSQSNALCHYVGKLAGLYPEDAMQALYCDEVLGALEDITHYMVQTFGLEGKELKQAREKLMNGRLTVYLKGLQELLARGGGKYFAGGKLSVADLKMLTMLKSLRSGNLDHIPAEFVDNTAPLFAGYQAEIEQEPQVVAYYESLK